MTSIGRRAATRPEMPGQESSRYRSLAFEQLLKRLERRGASQLLDLGPAIGGNVSFLSGLPAKLFIADLPQSLSATPSAEEFASLLDRELPDLERSSLDAVLAWDLLNYLRPEEIETLARRLAAHCAPDALLFALITTSPEMPDRPQRFEIADRQTLVYLAAGRSRRSSPRYNEPDLIRWLTGFEVDVTYLLRNGMQEYLFALSAPVLAAAGAT